MHEFSAQTDELMIVPNRPPRTSSTFHSTSTHESTAHIHEFSAHTDELMIVQTDSCAFEAHSAVHPLMNPPPIFMNSAPTLMN
jgi:hypothetical protein